ncbi:MAG: magnesium transporter [Tepidisphaeraceae bacterium]
MSNARHSPDTSASVGGDPLGDLMVASTEEIASYLEDAHPADAAAVLRRLPRERGAEVAEYLDPRTAGLLLREMHPALAASVVAEMEPPEASVVLSEMAPDDRVDILNHVPAELREELIRELDTREAAEVRRLASYPADSAGGIMTTEAVALNETITAEQAVAELRRIGEEVEQVYYVYAVDASGRLTGVLSMRDLIFAPPDQPLGVIKRADVVTVPVAMDQEEVARVLRRHGYLALPVVDDDHRLLGVITSDDLADVAEEEATEDIQKIGGTQALHAPYFEVGLASMLRKRGGWLSVLFLGEMLTATAMGFFESEIQRAAMVALFVPLIISSGGNSGSQATTIVIRSLALREIALRDWWRICSRELTTGVILGLFLGLIGALRITLWYYFGWHDYGGHPYRMAATIWISLAGVVTFGSAVGSMLPMVMHRVGLDPASASAPFVATLVDVTGLVIYFMVAIAILSGTVL